MAKPIVLTTESIREDNRTHTMAALLPTGAVNVFSRQMRETYSGIEELAESFVDRGQLKPGISAALTPRQAGRFIKALNELWGTCFRIEDATPSVLDGKRYYVMLIAGHRRYLACKIAVVKDPKKITGYRTELRFGMNPEEALSVQFAENLHEKVPPHEEARSIALSWRWLKKRHPNYTMVKFARTLNRTSSWVSNALRFVALPEFIQECADDKRLAYGVLVQLARLIDTMNGLEKPLADAEMRHWVKLCIVHRYDEADVRALVSKHLFDTIHEQTSLFGDGTYDERPLRRIVAEHLIRIILDNVGYLESLSMHRQKGGFLDESYLDPETDPAHLERYSLGSPLKLLERWTRYLEGELPHFEDLAAKHGGRHRKAIQHGRRVATRARQLVTKVAAAEPTATAK